ncbi:MAG: hypothetical protein A3A96_00480 [Candidatus Zambryskibacteria bacterium RIFCSPLOWO2_01_FULL_39_39]|uniref:Uncharacterized protein n=1 Tax=Candidatus Zambryskibacteria bacterium RIFCSPLOWO2_01_FULL_39_39 TaxID=1802758 RepID=A0A1G2TZB9_9BACT|nr:MAG: hypothetical protein A3A96_00480 [Candidatus Zambryskibacteria bacterium RIFCSPLOWO2_01_FULL_39_39]
MKVPTKSQMWTPPSAWGLRPGPPSCYAERSPDLRPPLAPPIAKKAQPAQTKNGGSPKLQ